MDDWGIEPLSAQAVAAVRESADALVADVVRSVVRDGSVYAEILDGPEGLAIRMGIEQAVRAFLDAVEQGVAPSPDTAELWRRLGEVEFQSGRSLDGLRSAFRAGTRAAWRGAADLAAAAGVPTTVVIALAEAIFVYSDELASGVVEGYLRMQTDEAGEIERRRRRLATLLVDPDVDDPETIARAAALARWTLPRSLAVLAVAGQDSPGAIARGLGVDALVGTDAEGVFIIVPDPDGPGRRAALEGAVGRAALGPAVPPREAHRSLRWARLAVRLLERGVLGGGVRSPGPVRVDEHLASLILLADEELARELVRTRLSALAALPVTECERLVETLAAWFAFQRHVPAIAESLHVHPQTVRYRVAKLRELLGEALESPQARFELELAVRIRRAFAT